MGDLLSTGLAWLTQQLGAHAAETVTYRRGAQSVSLAATVGSSILQIGDGTGATRIERTDADFLIAAADLALGGAQVEPQRHDTIDRTIGGTVYRYEVLAPQGEPPWRYSDPGRTMLRIHAKYTGTV